MVGEIVGVRRKKRLCKQENKRQHRRQRYAAGVRNLKRYGSALQYRLRLSWR